MSSANKTLMKFIEETRFETLPADALVINTNRLTSIEIGIGIGIGIGIDEQEER